MVQVQHSLVTVIMHFVNFIRSNTTRKVSVNRFELMSLHVVLARSPTNHKKLIICLAFRVVTHRCYTFSISSPL